MPVPIRINEEANQKTQPNIPLKRGLFPSFAFLFLLLLLKPYLESCLNHLKILNIIAGNTHFKIRSSSTGQSPEKNTFSNILQQCPWKGFKQIYLKVSKENGRGFAMFRVTYNTFLWLRTSKTRTEKHFLCFIRMLDFSFTFYYSTNALLSR